MKKTISIDANTITTSEMYQILTSAVAPRPIALASTVDINGKVNLSPFSFFNVFSINPPVLIFSPVRRVKDNTLKHTLENVKETKEVVVNIVNFPMVEQVSLSSAEYARGVNEFSKSGFTEVPSFKIKPPRVAESPISFECIVSDIIELGDQGGAGNLVLCEVVQIHIDSKYLKKDGKLDVEELNLVARMGSSFYTNVTASSLFEIPKPNSSKGIGIDVLPKHIFETSILSGNNLGRLGNISTIPSIEEIELHKKRSEVAKVLEIQGTKDKLQQLHTLIKIQIENNQLSDAIKSVFCY